MEVRFDRFPDVRLDYKALAPVARTFAAAAAARQIARVRIDDIVTDMLNPLPCAALWL
ncbi:hypothetical protein [Nocardia sp. NPDC057227]|uniref:hypothetical protein n=1 Tax=Nocardia sp. NPDC057227 TaxID=3346056 RepID=UPI0036322B58